VGAVTRGVPVSWSGFGLDRADRLWSFHSQLQVPLAHIRGVEVDPDQARLPWSGLPVRGENRCLPGLIAAGQVRQDGQWAFWEVHNPERAVIIHLADECYARLVIEVDDPSATATRINQALAVDPTRSTGGSG
jgi:hypothetical protein